jgi:HK97 family phage major capsid protein
MSGTLTELRGKLQAKRDELAKIFEEAGPDRDMSKVTSIEGDSAAKVEHIQSLDRELNDLHDDVKAQEALEGIATRVTDLGQVEPHPGHVDAKGRNGDARKTIGQLFTESDAFKAWKPGVKHTDLAEFGSVDLLANTFETATGWAPAEVRGPRVTEFATRPIQVVDIFPQGQTTQSAIVYMEETLFSNSAAEVAEGGTKPEVSLGLTERNEPVRKIAAVLPVTDEQLADVPQARSYIDNRLGFMVRQRLDSQLLVGDGTAPNLSGILDRTGLQSQALGGDTVPDATYKAMVKVQVNAFSEPNWGIFHPNDWQTVRLLKTSDGIYIWGPPMDAGPMRIWGLPVLATTAITENTGLVGDFRQAELVMRQGLTLQVSDSHDDYFVKNLLAIRAELRAALAVYRPAAFCKITGI